VSPHTKPQWTPKTLLVVDDDSDVRDVLEEVLEDAGYAVVCAEHGEEALAYLHASPAPDAILLDLFMPVMSGWDFARHLRKSPDLSAIPVLVITCSEPYWGYPGPFVLRKPLDLQQLLGTIRDMLEGEDGGGGPAAGGPSGRPVKSPRALPS
jgi:DNA-binding NtrC family response regulator